MLSSPHLQANQKCKQADEQWRNPWLLVCMRTVYLCLICNRKKTWKEETHPEGEVGGGTSAFRKEKKRNLGDGILTSARHSPTLTVNLVRMTLVGEREWINSIWHGDELWPFRRGGGCRDRTFTAVWVAECHRCMEKVLCLCMHVCMRLSLQDTNNYAVNLSGLSAKSYIAIKIWHGSSQGYLTLLRATMLG